MTSPFSAHGHGELAVDDGRARQLGDELRERPLDRREQLEQLAEARHRVVGRQELREDVAAADRAAKTTPSSAVAALRQLGRSGGRAHDLEAARSASSLDVARDRDRERRPCRCQPARADQAQEEQQRLLDRDLAALLVDEEEPLAGAVEDRAEVGADRADEPLRLADRLAQRDARSRVASVVNPCAETASTPSGPSTSGRTNDAAE